jgi:hypothetical protein
MKTFKEWVKKRIKEVTLNPLQIQNGISAVFNQQQTNPSPNVLANQLAQGLPSTVLASLADNEKMKKIIAMNTLKPKINKVITPQTTNQVMTPGGSV